MDKMDTYAMCAAMRAQSQPSLQAARQLTNNEWLTIQTNRSAEYDISIDQAAAQKPAPAAPVRERQRPQPSSSVTTASAKPVAGPAVPVVRPPTYLREIHARHNQVGKK